MRRKGRETGQKRKHARVCLFVFVFSFLLLSLLSLFIFWPVNVRELAKIKGKNNIHTISYCSDYCIISFGVKSLLHLGWFKLLHLALKIITLRVEWFITLAIYLLNLRLALHLGLLLHLAVIQRSVARIFHHRCAILSFHPLISSCLLNHMHKRLKRVFCVQCSSIFIFSKLSTIFGSLSSPRSISCGGKSSPCRLQQKVMTKFLANDLRCICTKLPWGT